MIFDNYSEIAVMMKFSIPILNYTTHNLLFISKIN